MALNNSQNIETMPANGTSVTGKRKSARKAPASGLPARPVQKPAAAPQEILFKELPDPYRQPVAPYLWIDFPIQNERLLAPTYVIRLGVGGAETVELAIDKGPWFPCRLTSGYWWFDWSAIAPGKHQLVARMKTADGRWYRTPPRLCDYRP